jgi:hypothetical protein
MRSTPSRSIIDIENLQHFSDTLTIIPIRRVARGARCQRSVDRNSFRSPCGECDSGSVQPRPPGSTSVRTAIIRYAPRAVGLMEIEK